MEIARIDVGGAVARVKHRNLVPAGLVGGFVTVEYSDPLWGDLTKTVVFNGTEIKDMVTNERTIKIPHEAVASPGKRLQVGFYGTTRDGTLVIPTLWTDLGMIQSAADPSGDLSTNPTLPVYAQLAQHIDDLKDQIENMEFGGSGGNGKFIDPKDGEVFILDDEPSAGDTPGTYVPVTGISLNKSTLSLTVGKSEVLIADIRPDNATIALVNWTTSNPNAATVAKDGTVTAVGVGNAIITATSRDTTNGTISASCSVACAAAESGGDTGGDTDGKLDIPSTNLMAYYDLRKPLNDSGQIVDLSGNEVNLSVNNQDYGIVITNGYISREGHETYNNTGVPVSSVKDITIDETITVLATISNYENKTTPVIGFGKGNNPCLMLYTGGVIFYNGDFNYISANTKINTDETYHVLAVSLDKNGKEKIYINGVLKSDMAVKTFPGSGSICPLKGYISSPSTKIRLHNAAFYSSVLDDRTVTEISNVLKANAGGVV